MSLLVGIDLGGTAIKVALADARGEIFITESIATRSQEGPDAVIERMIGLIRRLLAQHDVPRELIGIGIGVPGLVDVPSGVTRFLPNFPTQWRDIPLARRIGDAMGCPVRLLNDVRTATLGELRFGHGREIDGVTMAFFSIGTGIGGGVVVDGRLRLGPLGAAGEIGHQTMVPGGPRCGCGNRGCLEAIASGSAIAAQGVRLVRSGLAPRLRQIVGDDDARVTTRTMMQAAPDDPPVMEAIRDAAKMIGIAAANVVTILHPSLIVLGGGVAEAGPVFVEAVADEMHRRVGMFPTADVRVERSMLGDRAGVVGAIALAMPPTMPR